MGQLVFQATAGGQVALVGPNPSSSFALNVPAVNGNLVTTGDTGTVTNTMLASNVYTAPGTIGSVTPNTGAFTDLSYTGTLTGGTGVVNLGSGQFYKDASGNVGIGTTSPTYNLDISGNVSGIVTARILNTNSGSSSYSYLRMGNDNNSDSGLLKNSSTNTSAYGGANSLNLYQGGAFPIAFVTNNLERMRLDSSGNLLVGTTTSLASGLTVTGGSGPQFSLNTTTRYTQISFYNSGTLKSFIAWDNTNTNLYVQNSSGGVYLTNTGTSWTSNSDERLKENLVDITNGLSKVCSLRSVIGNFIADETKKKTPFLIAQDVQTVLPEAVTTSTLKDDETNTEYLGIAYTEVIPLLVASIKELNAKVDAQAVEIATLQAK